MCKTKCLYLLMFVMSVLQNKAQCSGGTNGGSLSPAPTSAYQSMNTTSGNYYTFTVPVGCMPTYDFSFCAADGSNASYDSQITILDNSGNYAGGYNDDFCGLQSHLTWTPTASGTYRVLINTFSCGSGSIATLAYKITNPPNMTFSSSTVVQSSTAGLTKCDLDQTVICVQVITTGNCNALSLTQFQLAAGSSTNATLADVSKIHIYYTGTTNVFSSTSEFVSGGTVPAGGSNTINGSQMLASGTNYFWIAYDINPASTSGNAVDASCTQITVAGVNQIPSATNPAGTRTISACASYPGTSALNLKHWVKSDAGVTGSPVSAWADQSGAGITGNMIQATAANQPTIQSSAVNFQDYLRFDGVNDILVSANTFIGTTLYNATDNTVFMIKNIKSGLVDYKWETAPTGSYRVGEELNGSAQRIDFSDDVNGKNSLSSTAITNKDVMVEFTSDATSLTLKLNGNTDAVKTLSTSFAPGTTTKPLNIGANDLGNPLYCNVDIAEVMTFNKKLSASEMRRVETYLGLKYGITVGNNQGSGAAVPYMESDGTQIWSNHTGYHNYVIGLGRDNSAGNSLLNKLKTTSVSSLNGSTDIITLANGSLTTPAAITNDKTFLISGSDAGSLALPQLVFADHNGPTTTIAYQLTRTWATQKTGTLTGDLIISVNTVPINGPTGYGTNINADLRLLVDDNTNFYDGSAGEHTYSPNAGYSTTGGTVNFTVPYADIQSGTGYYTIGSVNTTDGTLPIELTNFTADCVNKKTMVKWTTASEINNNFFTVERSANAIDFTSIAKINGTGTTNIPHNYSFSDNDPGSGINYYRLRQTDFNGQSKYFNTISSVCRNSSEQFVSVFPNPFENNFNLAVTAPEGTVIVYKIYNSIGQLVLQEIITQDKEAYFAKRIEIESGHGIYFLMLDINGERSTYKLVCGK